MSNIVFNLIKEISEADPGYLGCINISCSNQIDKKKIFFKNDVYIESYSDKSKSVNVNVRLEFQFIIWMTKWKYSSFHLFDFLVDCMGFDFNIMHESVHIIFIITKCFHFESQN